MKPVIIKVIYKKKKNLLNIINSINLKKKKNLVEYIAYIVIVFTLGYPLIEALSLRGRGRIL
jgi:hypothetical protein